MSISFWLKTCILGFKEIKLAHLFSKISAWKKNIVTITAKWWTASITRSEKSENRIKYFSRIYTDSFHLHFVSTNKKISEFKTKKMPLNSIYNHPINSRDRLSSEIHSFTSQVVRSVKVLFIFSLIRFRPDLLNCSRLLMKKQYHL